MRAQGAARPGLGLALLSLAVILVVACSGGVAPITHYYTLGAPGDLAAQSLAETLPGLAVGVDSFSVDPPYDQDRLVYRKGEGSAEVGFYSHHRWASPLGRLLATAMAQGLRGTSGIASIEPAESSGTYSARLGGRLIYLEEVESPDGQGVRIGLEMELRAKDGEVLWTASLAGSASGNASSGTEVFGQVRQAFEAIVTEASSGIEGSLAGPGGV